MIHSLWAFSALRSTPEKPIGNGKIRVLVVEDYEDNRLMLKLSLQGRGITVLEATNGKEGVAVASQELPDLILMDLSMPVMDGFEATRQIKQSDATQHIPVLALSAHCSNPAQHQMALESGCFDCLPKPFDFPSLEKALQSL